jgi:hypothetical protein
MKRFSVSAAVAAVASSTISHPRLLKALGSLGTLAAAALAFGTFFTPAEGWACACGCGVFDVGTSSMFPTGAGGMAFLEFDYQDQKHNWSGTSSAPSANNGDKEIATQYYTAGLQYMFNRTWGIQAELPFWNRTFKTDTNFGSSPSNVVSTQWSDLGDVRVQGIYTGFSDDLSSGINFGIKLPTGDDNFNPAIVDRDSQIGTGSTDLLLGGYHRGGITSDNTWSWFAQGLLDQPVLTRGDYRPGTELDTAVGINYNGFMIGNTMITPVAQVIASERTRDSGSASASPVASGFQRIMLSPGLEVDVDPVMLYADVEVPVYDHVTGNQLVAPVLFKMIAGYRF